jgi:arginyl-tRNA synthetase
VKSIHRELEQRVSAAIAAIGADGAPLVMPSNDERHGDYQSNCAMGLAKKLKQKPRDVATKLVEALAVDDMCETPEIAGPGFINFKLRAEYLAGELSAVPRPDEAGGERLGMAVAEKKQTIAVDLSSPNLAKEMHVGHLRSTVIGDAVSNILEFLGHDVIRENHVGDWGTQFGMLVAYLRHTNPGVLVNPDDLEIADLESFYVAAKQRFDDDEAFKKESQETVVQLQQGDESTRRVWQAFCTESLRHCHAIYERLDVSLIDRGESFYNDLMPVVIERLEKAGLAVESDGALVVYLDGYETRDGDPLPLIVRKRDGGYNYASSDLATIAHRVDELKVDGIVYVVGSPQKQHFEMLFATVEKAGWAPDVWMEHLGFGSMLAASGKPFKTREGGTFKLKDLLDQAVEKARAVVGASEGRGFSDAEMDDIAEAVGIAAIKYYDLSHNLAKDYKFELDSMLALDGNTAPYMMYAYARIRSIGRKAAIDFDTMETVPLLLEHPAEIALAKKILRFADILDMIGRDLRPNVLTDYLYELGRTFSRFYDRKLGVRVIDAEPADVRASRLRLAELTARTLRIGLELLGIRTVEKM